MCILIFVNNYTKKENAGIGTTYKGLKFVFFSKFGSKILFTWIRDSSLVSNSENDFPDKISFLLSHDFEVIS